MKQCELLIIGAGAAGLSAGLYAARSGIIPVIIDEAGGGGQITQIDNLENYPGVFPAVNGFDFIETLSRQAKNFGASIITSTVRFIDKKDSLFTVSTDKETYQSPALIFATGAVHSTLDVPGEKELTGRGVSYCAVCDGPFFKNKQVIVVGGGDSAVTEAIYLSQIASSVQLIHRRDSLRAQKTLQDKLFENEKITVHFNKTVTSIKGSNKVQGVELKDTVTGEISELNSDAVFIFTGIIPRTTLLENLPKDMNGYILTNEKMETAVPGLFAAGDVRSKPLRQIVTAASDGAIAGFFAADFAKDFKN